MVLLAGHRDDFRGITVVSKEFSYSSVNGALLLLPHVLHVAIAYLISINDDVLGGRSGGTPFKPSQE